MEPMYLQVLQKETGRQIKKLLVENGYTVKDVQNAMGFENPQAVYKWISGRSLPSLDNFVILSRLLHTSTFPSTNTIQFVCPALAPDNISTTESAR